MSLARFKVPLATISPQETVEQAARIMRDRGVGSLVVRDAGHLAGIITDRDLVVRVLAEGVDPTSARVGNFVTYGAITASVHEDLETAAERMRLHGIRRLPIVDDQGDAVGIVTADDLLVLLGRELSNVCDSIENRSDSSESR
ncbi:MAG: CBS domain-containing protein [Polyangiaceae bacterium]